MERTHFWSGLVSSIDRSSRVSRAPTPVVSLADWKAASGLPFLVTFTSMPEGWPVAVSARGCLAELLDGVGSGGVAPHEAKKRIAISINSLFMSFVACGLSETSTEKVIEILHFNLNLNEQVRAITWVLTSNEGAARGRAENSACERFPAFIHHQFPNAQVLIGFTCQRIYVGTK